MARIHLIILVLLTFLSGPCFAQIPERMNLLSAARYSELEQLVEKEVKDDPQPPSYKLIFLCQAYSNLKKYKKLFHCLDELQNNINRGDTAHTNLTETPMLGLAAFVGSIVGGGSARMRGDVTPFLHLLRSQAYTELRNYDKAIAEAKQAEATIPNQERGIHIMVLTALGLSHAFAGKKEEAERYAESLSDLSTAFPYSGLVDIKLAGIAKIYIATGNYKKAYEGLRSDFTLFRPLMAFGDALGGAMVGMKGESGFTYQELPKMFMTAKTQLEVGEIQQAKEGYDKLLQYRQVASNGEIYWMLLFDRGRIAAGEGDFESAINFWEKAIDVIEQQRSSIDTEANKIGFVGDKQAVYRHLISALYTSQQYPAAFEYVERAKSRALVDMLAAKQDFAVSGGDSAKVKTLLATASNAEADSLAQDFATDKSQTRSLAVSARQQLNRESPELSSLINVSSLTAPEIQAIIPPDEALIEYYYDAPDLIAFVLTAKSLSAVRLDSRTLLDDIRNFRKQLESASSADYLELSRRIYSQLITPVTSLTTASKLIVVAHGPLHYLPFNALHDGQSYLIEHYSLRMLPSASVLRYLRTQAVVRPGGVLAFGNPDLGDPKLDLVHAQEEAIAVTQNRSQSKVLLRKDANETALRQYGGDFRYLHFATHGEFNPDTPLKSALLLARDENSDGLLTVDKLYTLKLDADLVTLSACETGLGKIASGDDVVGLTRGFLYAGSRSIVASLWKVDDLATSYLMMRFYDNLKSGDKREALRQAQLATLKKYPHPYYWAAFQLTGRAE